jgi:AraC family transcriptional regulator
MLPERVLNKNNLGMSEGGMGKAEAETGGERTLRGGSFYGAIARRLEQHGAIFTDLRHTEPRKLPAHAHELPFFWLLLGGDYAERYGRQVAQAQPFTMAFRPAGVPHQDEIGPRGVRLFGIEVGPGWSKRLQADSGSLEAAQDSEGGELLWLGLKVYRATRGPVEEHDLVLESLLAELLGAVAHPRRAAGKGAPPWLARVVENLRAECCRRLTLDGLAREAGVHPVHLSRVFRRCTGRGIGEYVHRLRIRAACEQMLEPEKPLAEIALEAGFADQSHFTRAFRCVTGMSPGAFRAGISLAAPSRRFGPTRE